jgi:hypothetical protein
VLASFFEKKQSISKIPSMSNWGDEPIESKDQWGKPPTPTDLFKDWEPITSTTAKNASASIKATNPPPSKESKEVEEVTANISALSTA